MEIIVYNEAHENKSSFTIQCLLLNSLRRDLGYSQGFLWHSTKISLLGVKTLERLQEIRLICTRTVECQLVAVIRLPTL